MFAIDRDRKLGELYHTGWTAKDGAPQAIQAIAQSADGFMWLGTLNGLFRFDGVRFERFEPQPSSPFPDQNIRALFATPDGGLWISFRFGGVSLLKTGSITNYSGENGPPSWVEQFVMDRKGTMWAVTPKGLGRFDGFRWQTIAADWAIAGECYAAFVDRQGILWVSTQSGVRFLRDGSTKFEVATDAATDGFDMAESLDGKLWIAQLERSVRVVPLPWDGKNVRRSEIRVGSQSILIDKQGSLWIPTVGDGLRRVPYPERLNGQQIAEFGSDAESFTHKDGLTNDFVDCILQDQQGNIWVGTNEGLDCFRQSAFVPVELTSGTYGLALAPAGKGTLWVSATNRPLMRVQDGSAKKETMFADWKISSIHSNADGSFWMGRENGLLHFVNGRIDRQIKTPGALPLSIDEDADRSLWVSFFEGGDMRFENGKWTTLEALGGPKEISTSDFSDARGHVWLGFAKNRLAKTDGDKVQMLSENDGIHVGRVMTIQGQGSDIWIGGDYGLEILNGERFRPVIPVESPAFTEVYAVVATSDDGLWFSEHRGIVHVPMDEIERFKRDPGYRVHDRVFGFQDGIPSVPERFLFRPTAAQGTDGRIWFALTQGIAWVDPARIPKYPFPPASFIMSVVANGESYSSRQPVRLPAQSRNLQILYTAPTLSEADQVRFRYRLEGQDKNWIDAGQRREAFYTNLGPGKYTFQVITSNASGVWNESGSRLLIQILPAWYQTYWFRALCVIALMWLTFMLYLVRMRSYARSMRVRFDERLSERTRLARELHDTLLQTIQGSKLVAEGMEEYLDDPPRAKQSLAKLSQWLSQAVDEGRAALESLRNSNPSEQLSEALRLTADECAPNSMRVLMTVTGNIRPIHPVAKDEVCRIAFEAIRNACVHSGGSTMTIAVKYSRDLKIQIHDNGRGFDPNLVLTGRPGHFGIAGMKERASTIGARLSLQTSVKDGTQFLLVIPGRVMFRSSDRRWHRLLSKFMLPATKK